MGNRRISRRQLSHNRFQEYLYQTLDPVERAYLHEAIGRALESVYQGHSEEIAVHLARRFQEAGLLGKTVVYLRQARAGTSSRRWRTGTRSGLRRARPEKPPESGGW